MKTRALLVVLLLCSAATADVADMLERLPDRTTVVLTSEDFRPAMGRLLFHLEKARDGKLLPQGVPWDAILLTPLRTEMTWMKGPGVMGFFVDARGRRRPFAIRAVNSDARAVRVVIANAYGGAKDRPDLARGVFSFRRGMGSEFYAFVRSGALYETRSRATLKALLKAADAKKPCALSAFYRKRRKLLGQPGALTLLLAPRVIEEFKKRFKVGGGMATYWLKALGLEARPAGLTWNWSAAGETVVAVLPLAASNALCASLCPASGRMKTIASAPGSAMFAIGGNVPDLRVYVKALEHVMRTLDPRIRDEFRQELAEYNLDANIDFERDALGAVTGDWAFAALWRDRGFPGTLLILEAKDPAKLTATLRAMAKQAKFPWAERGGIIFTKWIVWPVAMSFRGKLLFVANSRTTLKRALQAAESKDTLARKPLVSQALAGRTPGALVYSSLQLPNMRGMKRGAEELRKIIGPNAGAVLFARFDKDALIARLNVRPSLDKIVMPVMKHAFSRAGALGRRRMVRRSMSSLRQLGVALHAWAADHKGAFPMRLADLAKYISRSALSCPLTGPYIYLGAGLRTDTKRLSRLMLACTRAPVGPRRRRVALYADGHVAMISDAGARKAIEKQRRESALLLAPEKRPGFLWKKADPFDKTSVWAIFDWGVSVRGPDGVSEHRDLFGEKKLVVKAIAFTMRAVWLGANKGLFRWSRKDRFWTRVAVDAKLFSPDVTALSVKNGGLDVRIKTRKGAAKYVFDLTRKTWQEK